MVGEAKVYGLEEVDAERIPTKTENSFEGCDVTSQLKIIVVI